MTDKNEIKKYSVIDHISKLYVTSYNAETDTITTGSEDDRLLFTDKDAALRARDILTGQTKSTICAVMTENSMSY